MKRSVTVAPVILLACTLSVLAATEQERLDGIRRGLAYLYNTQHTEGYWSASGNEQSTTGAAVSAFLSHRDKWGDNANRYQLAVEKGIRYVVNSANVVDLSTRTDGLGVCAAGSTPCKGVYWFGNGQSTRATGLISPAIAAYARFAGADTVATTTGPLAGMTWAQIAQAITNTLVASQNTRSTSAAAGGWGPSIPGGSVSDSISTFWATVSLLYAETLGAVTPNVVKGELKSWLPTLQSASGAVCRQPGSEPCTHADTGGWLLAMQFVGSDVTNPGVQDALNFLNTSWQASGNFGTPSAMWAVYGGLGMTVGLNDTTHLTNMLTHCGGQSPCTWSEDYAEWLVKNVTAGETRDDAKRWIDPLTASFYINILGSTRLPLMSDSFVTQTFQQPNSVTAEMQASSTAAALTSTEGSTLTAAASTRIRPRVLKGVTAVSLTPDGTALAAAGADKRIRIWAVPAGQQRLVAPPALSVPTALAFSSDGNTLASVGRDSIIRLFDAISGSERAKLAGHEHPIRAVAASSNGAFLASAGEETRILIWNQTTGKLARIVYGATNFVNGLSFSPDSRLLAAAGEDARVLVYDVAQGKLLHTLRGHAGAIDAIGFSPDGTLLASAGQDTVIRLWDPARGQQMRALKGHEAPIRTVAFSPDSRIMATGGEDTQIVLWNTQTGQLQKVLRGSTGFINALTFDSKGRFLVSATDTGEITLWNVTAGVRMITLVIPAGG